VAHRSGAHLQARVADEVRTGLYFIGEVFWEVLPRILTPISTGRWNSITRSLHSPARWFTLGSWIGGDRDANPNVTAAVTAETLRLHAAWQSSGNRAALHDVSRRFSLSARRVPPPAAIDRVARRAGIPCPSTSPFWKERYAGEPYRLTLSLLSADLEYASQEQ